MRTADGRVRLTPRVLRLGMAYVGALGLWDIARPHLGELVAHTHESSSMAQLDGSDIVYVARVAVPKIIALRVQIGTRFPALYTSQGKVLLAALGADELTSVLAEPSRSGLPPFLPRDPRWCAPSWPRSVSVAGPWPTRNWRPASARSRHRYATGRVSCVRR